MAEEKKKKSNFAMNFMRAASLALIATTFATIGVSAVGLSDEEGARNILKTNGYTEAEYKGKAGIMRGCNNGGLWRDEFNAKNLAGNKVDVTVCQGPFKFMEIKQWNPNP